MDPDRWEFANEGFLRGQRELLKTIVRRKPASGHNHQLQPQLTQTSSVGPCVEVGKFGLEEEVERLKRGKNVLMQELVRLRLQQQGTDNQMQSIGQRLQGMEQRQQQMMSFLAKAVNSPGFLAHFVQQQNTEGNKKRRLKQDGVAVNGHNKSTDGQIVKYQPPTSSQFYLPEVTAVQSAPFEANSDVVATSPLGDGEELAFIPDLDTVPDSALFDPNLVPLPCDSNVFEMDSYLPENDPSISWEQILEMNQEVDTDTMQEMDLGPMCDYVLPDIEAEPLENASPTGQVQQLMQQMGLLSSETKEA